MGLLRCTRNDKMLGCDCFVYSRKDGYQAMFHSQWQAFFIFHLVFVQALNIATGHYIFSRISVVLDCILYGVHPLCGCFLGVHPLCGCFLGVHPLCGCIRQSRQFRYLRSKECTVYLASSARMRSHREGAPQRGHSKFIKFFLISMIFRILSIFYGNPWSAVPLCTVPILGMQSTCPPLEDKGIALLTFIYWGDTIFLCYHQKVSGGEY